jgi:formylglycine-generating enzyme required for sulfatase activity
MNSLLVFILPTEAQWEYACRAGTKTPFNTGEMLTHKLANFERNVRQTVDVNRYVANPWGLKQMHGNVWEWCADGRRQYLAEPKVDPAGATDSEQRAVRGGSWFSDGRYCRSAARYDGRRGSRHSYVGFRLAGF